MTSLTTSTGLSKADRASTRIPRCCSTVPPACHRDGDIPPPSLNELISGLQALIENLISRIRS